MDCSPGSPAVTFTTGVASTITLTTHTANILKGRSTFTDIDVVVHPKRSVEQRLYHALSCKS